MKYKEIYNDDNNEEYQILKEKLKVLPETVQTELNEMLGIIHLIVMICCE
ncbi:hypothetical protein RPO_07365 [Rickettsia rickettsii str. Arizona]|uniref:Uncharacterized protein n=1 Tax=Rickettsia rickettsii (strain Iowa) TaxID=452659 RepID=B0BVM1_RICRO|nr:hypothetical protein RrIowa_1564 [Rickettsia rickettsii str. Iowa]AFB25584.1 hypothetical protein RPO_07365 [Rickettsia rickettsii str. Arizona]AFB28264.1 hypothetical protein RPJ_07330 [Rickettsia rickettsii str. Hino]AFB30925.1 hypothetical protein RPM_07340 [Rickettsia rickettsii str. Hauke]AJG34972.1 hypothetical protein RRM_06865 [Rickettsia rickettsii str. Morgan]APU56227.1 hypothetical protein BTU50_1564 [Rickettsia rickettsii]